MGIKIMILAFFLGAAYTANAKTFYFIGGKEVSRVEAMKATMSNPSTEVLKVQVNHTKLNQKTFRLNKTDDAELKDIPR